MWTSCRHSELEPPKELDDERFGHYSKDEAAYIALCAPAPPSSLKAQTTGRVETFKLEIPILKTASVCRMIERSGFLQNDLGPSLRGIADP